jgi:hypothetical protein
MASKPIYFFQKVGIIILVIQVILLLLLVLTARSAAKGNEKNIIAESCINAFSIMNIAFIVLFYIMLNFLLIPSQGFLIIYVLFSFLTSFVVSYLTLSESDEYDSGYNYAIDFKKIFLTFAKFRFPFYEKIGVSSVILLLIFAAAPYLRPKSMWLSSYLQILASILSIAGLYYLFGSYSNFKRKDELQRRIILEQTYFISRFVLGITFGTFFLVFTFRISINLFTMIGVLAPILMLSVAFIKDKYQ